MADQDREFPLGSDVDSVALASRFLELFLPREAVFSVKRDPRSVAQLSQNTKFVAALDDSCDPDRNTVFTRYVEFVLGGNGENRICVLISLGSRSESTVRYAASSMMMRTDSEADDGNLRRAFVKNVVVPALNSLPPESVTRRYNAVGGAPIGATMDAFHSILYSFDDLFDHDTSPDTTLKIYADDWSEFARFTRPFVTQFEARNSCRVRFVYVQHGLKSTSGRNFIGIINEAHANKMELAQLHLASVIDAPTGGAVLLRAEELRRLYRGTGARSNLRLYQPYYLNDLCYFTAAQLPTMRDVTYAHAYNPAYHGIRPYAESSLTLLFLFSLLKPASNDYLFGSLEKIASVNDCNSALLREYLAKCYHKLRYAIPEYCNHLMAGSNLRIEIVRSFTSYGALKAVAEDLRFDFVDIFSGTCVGIIDSARWQAHLKDSLLSVIEEMRFIFATYRIFDDFESFSRLYFLEQKLNLFLEGITNPKKLDAPYVRRNILVPGGLSLSDALDVFAVRDKIPREDSLRDIVGCFSYLTHPLPSFAGTVSIMVAAFKYANQLLFTAGISDLQLRRIPDRYRHMALCVANFLLAAYAMKARWHCTNGSQNLTYIIMRPDHLRATFGKVYVAARVRDSHVHISKNIRFTMDHICNTFFSPNTEFGKVVDFCLSTFYLNIPELKTRYLHIVLKLVPNIDYFPIKLLQAGDVYASNQFCAVYTGEELASSGSNLHAPPRPFGSTPSTSVAAPPRTQTQTRTVSTSTLSRSRRRIVRDSAVQTGYRDDSPGGRLNDLVNELMATLATSPLPSTNREVRRIWETDSEDDAYVLEQPLPRAAPTPSSSSTRVHPIVETVSTGLSVADADVPEESLPSAAQTPSSSSTRVETVLAGLSVADADVLEEPPPSAAPTPSSSSTRVETVLTGISVADADVPEEPLPSAAPTPSSSSTRVETVLTGLSVADAGVPEEPLPSAAPTPHGSSTRLHPIFLPGAASMATPCIHPTRFPHTTDTDRELVRCAATNVYRLTGDKFYADLVRRNIAFREAKPMGLRSRLRTLCNNRMLHSYVDRDVAERIYQKMKGQYAK